MRVAHIAIAVIGLATGAGGALALLYANPLTAEPAAELGGFDRVLRFDFPADGALLTHGGGVPLGRLPATAPELWESTIRSTATALFELDDEQARPAAVASKIVVPSERTDLLSAGIVLDDYWLVSIPGEGALFVLGYSNLWSAFKDNVVPVKWLRQPWGGPRSYRTTAGPGSRGTAIVLGAAGHFEGAGGSAVERFELKEFSDSAGAIRFASELHLRVVEDTAKD